MILLIWEPKKIKVNIIYLFNIYNNFIKVKYKHVTKFKKHMQQMKTLLKL